MRRVNSLEKTLMLGRDWGQEEKGTTEDEMAGWHHWLDGRESEWTPGDDDEQGGLACCYSWGRKESDTTERLNWTIVFNIEVLTEKTAAFTRLWSNSGKTTADKSGPFTPGLPFLLAGADLNEIRESILVTLGSNKDGWGENDILWVPRSSEFVDTL